MPGSARGVLLPSALYDLRVTLPLDVTITGTRGASPIGAFEVTKPRVLRRVQGTNELIVFLAMVAQLFFAIPALKFAQSAAEVVLFIVLLYACMTITFGMWETALLALLAAMTATSMLINPLSVLLVGVKQFGLAILCLIYFSRVRFRSRLIFPAFVVSVLLIAISRVAPSALNPLIQISRSPDFNESRFGGLFLNAHYNAYFLAVALIYYGYRTRLFGVGYVLLFLTGSKFVFVSYVANAVGRYRIARAVTGHPRLVLLAALAVVVMLWSRRLDIVGMFNTTQWMSAYVILSQLFDPRFYHLFVNPFPGDYLAVVNGLQGDYGAAHYTNEIALFAMSVQGGVFLTVAYLAVLLKRARSYRAFILVSLLHYGFVLSPLIVYMIVTYSREISLLPESQPRRGDPADVAA